MVPKTAQIQGFFTIIFDAKIQIFHPFYIFDLKIRDKIEFWDKNSTFLQCASIDIHGKHKTSLRFFNLSVEY